MRFGLNLYSIRTLISNEENFLFTAKKLKELGYDTMQFSGAPYDADMIRRVSNESGMPVVLTHVSPNRVISDTDALMREHESFGCDCIGIGGLPADLYTHPEELWKTIDSLDKAAGVMKKNGFTFCYHNHHMEFFRPDGGITPFEYILKSTENRSLTADVYWIQYGGADVIGSIEKLKGRIGCVHLKDYRINTKLADNGVRIFEAGFAPVGDGVFDFRAIIDASKKSGAKHFLVEQDDAVTYPDPLEQVGRSIKYLKENF